MAEGTIGVRIGIEREEAILQLVNSGIYNTLTDFVIEAIDEKLYPEQKKRARVNRILWEMKNNPEIREELTKILNELKE